MCVCVCVLLFFIFTCVWLWGAEKAVGFCFPGLHKARIISDEAPATSHSSNNHDFHCIVIKSQRCVCLRRSLNCRWLFFCCPHPRDRADANLIKREIAKVAFVKNGCLSDDQGIVLKAYSHNHNEHHHLCCHLWSMVQLSWDWLNDAVPFDWHRFKSVSNLITFNSMVPPPAYYCHHLPTSYWLNFDFVAKKSE